ncbi:MAG: hypothetical protein ACOX3T_05810 [Bdellovibrionota bacterium]
MNDKLNKKDYTISFIRLFALLLLFCCHFFEMAGYNFKKGVALGVFGNYCAVCVQLFLVISGFLYGRKANLFEKENRFHFIFKTSKRFYLIIMYTYSYL